MRDFIATVCFTSAIILFSATDIMSTELQTLPWEKGFREPSATLTPFSAPTDYEKVEEESEGPGWRYFRYLTDNSRKFIIYNHGYTAVVYPYGKFTKKRKRDLNTVGLWFQKHDVNFYAALRKDTSCRVSRGCVKDFTNKMMEDYGFTIEPLEVFYHLSKVINESFRENYSICYVGHSAGEAAPLFTSVFMNDKNTTHVSISPENGRNDRMEWCDHSFFQNDYPQKAKKINNDIWRK